VPYDILVEILEWLIEPEQDDLSKFEALWPFDILHNAPLRGSRAQIHLQACCLVCRWWREVAQPILQEHLCWSSSLGRVAVENLLKVDRVATKVTTIEAGRTYCELCAQDGSCSCGISIQMVVSTLATFPRLMRLAIPIWSGLDVALSIPSTPIRAFPQLTTFRILCTDKDGGWVPLRTFCLILQLMPALHTLSIGDISNASSDIISDIPYPPCQLRSFAVSDARGVEFQSYEWILHNSKNSLQILHTCGLVPASQASLLRAIPHLGVTLRELRCLGCWDSEIVLSVLQHCHKLEALACCDGPDILHDLANAACAKTLRRFTATKVRRTVTTRPSGYVLDEYNGLVIRFWCSDELAAMRQVVQRHALPQLEEWNLQTRAKERLVDVPVDELTALKDECDRQGVVFGFARYNEVRWVDSARV